MGAAKSEGAPSVYALFQRLSVAFFFFVLCVAYFLDIRDVRTDAAAYPRALIFIIVFLLILASFREYRAWSSQRSADGEATGTFPANDPDAALPVDRNVLVRARSLTVAAHLALILLMPLMGAVVSSAVFVGILAFGLGERRPLVLVGLPLITAAVINYVFIGFLGVPLP